MPLSTNSKLGQCGLVQFVEHAVGMGCGYSSTDGEGRGGREAGGRRHERINKDLHAFWLGDLVLYWRFESQDCFVSAQEVVDERARVLEALQCLRSHCSRRILVLVNVVNDDAILVSRHVGHDEVLLESCGQHRVAAVVDMLSDDIDAPWRSAVKGRSLAIQVSEATLEVEIALLVLGLDCVVCVLVDLV